MQLLELNEMPSPRQVLLLPVEYGAHGGAEMVYELELVRIRMGLVSKLHLNRLGQTPS